MSTTKKNQAHELQIQVPPEVQRGTYANQMLVTYSHEEFVLDFILATPQVSVANARVIVSPAHAKRILAALSESIAKYETQFGAIKIKDATSAPPGFTAH